MSLYPSLINIVTQYVPHLWDRDVGYIARAGKIYNSFDDYLENNKYANNDYNVIVEWYWMPNINKISQEYIDAYDPDIIEVDTANQFTNEVYPTYEYLVIALHISEYPDEKPLIYKIYVNEDDEEKVRTYITEFIEAYNKRNLPI